MSLRFPSERPAALRHGARLFVVTKRGIMKAQSFDERVPRETPGALRVGDDRVLDVHVNDASPPACAR